MSHATRSRFRIRMAGLTVSLWGRAASRSLSVVLTLVALTACIGPHKPVPTHKAEAAPAPAPERTDGPGSIEAMPAPAETTAGSLPPSPPVPPPAERAQSTSPDVPVVNVKPVYVMAQQESYHASHATTATKTDTPIMETPFSIQVVPKQVLEDVQAVRPGDALNYVSGIYQGSANSGEWLDWSRRRGFNNFPTGD